MFSMLLNFSPGELKSALDLVRDSFLAFPFLTSVITLVISLASLPPVYAALVHPLLWVVLFTSFSQDIHYESCKRAAPTCGCFHTWSLQRTIFVLSSQIQKLHIWLCQAVNVLFVLSWLLFALKQTHNKLAPCHHHYQPNRASQDSSTNLLLNKRVFMTRGIVMQPVTHL